MGQWRVSLLENLFLAHEVEIIKKIPLSPCWPQDEQVWHYTQNGIFTVKSAYHLQLERNKQSRHAATSSSSQKETAFWTKLWKMDLPPRIKLFIWKACKGILPTAQNIYRRLHRGKEECMRCGASVETDKHIFFDCYEAKLVWRNAEDIPKYNNGKCKSFKDWFALVMDSECKKVVERTAVILWLLRKSRNEKIFAGTEKGADQLCKYSQFLLHEFHSAQTLKEASNGYWNQPFSDSKWKPPENNRLKLNVDAAFKDDIGGIGLVVRNCAGEVEAVMVDYLPNCFDTQHAESLGFLRALQFSNEYGITHFELEGDALGVVNRITSIHEDLSMTGHIIAGIRTLLKYFPFVKISHVHRSKNCPAHVAAKIALKERSRKVWLSDFPQVVMDTVKFDS